jgi:hypothetical protein
MYSCLFLDAVEVTNKNAYRCTRKFTYLLRSRPSAHMIPLCITSVFETASLNVTNIKPLHTLRRGRAASDVDPHTCSMLKFVVDSFGLHTVLLTEGRVLDRLYEIWE